MYTLETKLAQIGNRSETATGTVNPPLYFSTAYRHEGIGQSTGYDYIRTGNPTRKLLEQAIADLECGDQGYACSSGMAAIQLVLSLFCSGDEILASEDLYGGSYRLFGEFEAKWGLQCRYVDMADSDAVRAAITPQTKALFVETPTNPLMQVTDISEVAAIAKEHGILLIVDNTFYTPVLQQPLLLGADIVLHSATKYLGGHNDVLAGLVAAKGEAVCQALFHYHNAAGAVLSPFDSWLVMRGMKTLALRMRQHEANAKAVAEFLRQADGITDVFYPGNGGMLSFRVHDETWVNPLLQSLKLITFAESLGGIESLMTYPATQTHADIPEEIRTARGVCNRLLRFSVGIENANDLIQDLQQALAAVREEVRA
ncbi:methionine biosynthesis PLP-dependent protein [Ectobacillus ponti]|uniref:Methionine biosynthesis PLP-dependent protein n=1 Tax=Ectobacillus ponti TaxID=2961894 RepID=A0AA42BP19_9BACI|nr:methionine biosynthesis PLP-dependent protein [Ectobacillus ponti]MCP8967119.1 methionine biosynthesis PLP-dependent protein [Ectobacillus ponti]